MSHRIIELKLLTSFTNIDINTSVYNIWLRASEVARHLVYRAREHDRASRRMQRKTFIGWSIGSHVQDEERAHHEKEKRDASTQDHADGSLSILKLQKIKFAARNFVFVSREQKRERERTSP